MRVGWVVMDGNVVLYVIASLLPTLRRIIALISLKTTTIAAFVATDAKWNIPDTLVSKAVVAKIVEKMNVSKLMLIPIIAVPALIDVISDKSASAEYVVMNAKSVVKFVWKDILIKVFVIPTPNGLLLLLIGAQDAVIAVVIMLNKHAYKISNSEPHPTTDLKPILTNKAVFFPFKQTK